MWDKLCNRSWQERNWFPLCLAGMAARAPLLSRRSVPKMLGEWLITMMDYLACFGVGNLFKISVIFAVDYPFLLEPFPRFSMEFVAGQLLGANVAFAGE
jgi:hypothetical protein